LDGMRKGEAHAAGRWDQGFHDDDLNLVGCSRNGRSAGLRLPAENLSDIVGDPAGTGPKKFLH